MSIIRDPLRGIVRPEPSHTDEEILDVLCSRPVRDWAVLTGAGFSTIRGCRTIEAHRRSIVVP